MKNSNMNTVIANIAEEAISQATMEACTSDRTATLNDVMLEVEIMVSACKFDTATAENMFRGFVDSEIRKQAPHLFAPVQYMDAKGNYTSNPKLWA